MSGHRVVVPPHLKERFDLMERMAPAPPPAPWRLSTTRIVGGLTDVGFADSSDLLLIVSGAGRGVLNCQTGFLVARDYDPFEFDIGNMLVEGIGPLAGVKVRMAGLCGGGLSAYTEDGWKVERYPLSWPYHELILSPPGQDMLWAPPGQPITLTKLGDYVSSVYAFGFSPTGRSLVVATASDVDAYMR